MAKTLASPDEIVATLNAAMKKSKVLDGDCRECQVRRVGRVTDQDAQQLGRNWNVDIVNGDCRDECMVVLAEVARNVGREFDAEW